MNDESTTRKGGMANETNRLSDEILIPDLEENLADDPYGTAIFAVRNVIHRAVANNGLMNSSEFEALKAIEEVVRRYDNA